MSKLTAICSILLIIALTGCGPKKVVEEIPVDCQPDNIQVNVNDGSMDVSWVNPCDQLISGYNVYISEEPLVEKYPGNDLPGKIKPNNPATYAGDTDPSDGVEHYQAEYLENGKKYFVSVRIVNADRSLSKPTREITAVCGPRKDITMAIRYKGENDGFSLEKNDYVRADQLENDLYFFSKDGLDQLGSPHKLDGFLKVNKFQKLSFNGDFETLRSKITTMAINPTQDKVDIAEGDWLLLRTVENKNALIKIKDIAKTGENRQVTMFVAYATLPGALIF